jgi:predicted SAM-dependent methyltransferase
MIKNKRGKKTRKGDSKERKKNLKLHIGCGKNYIPGFVHIDARSLPHIDYVTSADNLSFFINNSASLIYCSHVLEHFPRNKTISVLREWYRVLKPGGILRLAVPDFEILTEIYRETKDITLVLGPLVGRQDYPENTHYMVFDYTSLSVMLKEVGFKNIHRYNWRNTIHKDYDDYSQAYIPHMDKKNGRLISLNIECEK